MANEFSHLSDADLARRTLTKPGRTTLECVLAERLLARAEQRPTGRDTLTILQQLAHEQNATNFTPANPIKENTL